jgi:23S rRNA (cytosine1962-C5)-methyltransferase
MQNNRVVLKKGKDKAIRNHHHWIFSGAVESISEFVDGDILPVFAPTGELLGSGYFNHKTNIIGRMLCFDSTPPLQAIEEHVTKAFELRYFLFKDSQTNAYRLINGEGDFLPGLVVDRYNDYLVIQISTKGMEVLKKHLLDLLITLSKKILKINVSTIYEQSELPSRREEGLSNFRGVLIGGGNANDKEVIVIENALQFLIPLTEGQKTGFFLDHREMREMIKSLSQGKTVLNCFAYTGAFSVYALAGGANRVDTVEISNKALEIAHKNISLNGFDPNNQGLFAEDVFDFLREKELPYEIVILDPPAFAKKKQDVVKACRGYKDINRLAMQKMPAKSMLLTCSCSFHVNEELFQKVIFQAAVEANRNVRIIGRHRMAADHPVNICHPESDYLKSLLLYIE